MNVAFLRLVAWGLIGLHLADALLVSGGRWLAGYAHQHLAVCQADCGHAKPVCPAKKGCCGHHHHAKASPAATDTGLPAVDRAAHRDGFCDDCAACRHERQSLIATPAIRVVTVQPLLMAAEPSIPAAPVLSIRRAFDSRGPPTATS